MMGTLASKGLPAETLVDGYRVLRKLGSGGFGAVHQVEKNCRLYALKLALLPAGAGDDKKTHQRTVRELLCLLLLEHPNIVRVHGHGRYPDEPGGHLYLALEYVEGWTLAEWVERTHPTVLELLRVFEKLAAAVAYMHSRGVFHRDLKLINVIIRKSDGEPILIDFGAADFTQAPELTDAGLPPATERARAPEANRWWFLNRKKPQARYDFRVTDELFAFGVMLYDALTDPRPTEQRARTSVNSLLVPPRAVEERNPRIPAAMASLVHRLLARNPDHRPESFESVRRELAELREQPGAEYCAPAHPPSTQVVGLEQNAASAQHPSQVPAVPSRWRTHRMRWAGAVLSVAILAAVVAATIVSTPREKEHSVQTQENTSVAAPAAEKVPTFATEEERSIWCKAVGLATMMAVNAGCPGAQLRPELPANCPEDSIQAMEKHGLHNGDLMFATFGEGKDYRQSPPLKGGRIEATVISDPDTKLKLPLGTRLLGELWPNPIPEEPRAAYARFDRVRLPSGEEFPVCFITGGDNLAVFSRPAPNMLVTPPEFAVEVTYRYERPW